MNVPGWLRSCLVVLGVLLVQLVVVGRIELAGVSGNLLVVLPVTAGLVAGSEKGAIFGFAAGLALDTLLTTPLGLTALVWVLAGYVAGMIGTQLIRSSVVAAAGLCALAAAASTVAFVLAGAVLGQSHLLSTPVARIALVSSLVAAVGVIPLLPLVRWALFDPHDPVRAGR